MTPSGLLSGVDEGFTTLTVVKDGVTSNTVTINVTKVAITNITVSPSTVSIVKGNNLQLTAIATHADSSTSNVTDSVTWIPVDTAIAAVAWNGLLSGVEMGTTTLTATKDSVTSNVVTVTVCEDLSGPCIDAVDIAGKLYTPSPSVAYLDSIGGGSATNGFLTESGGSSPSGNFYIFDLANAIALCDIYNAQNVLGRNNWQLPTKVDLVDLYDLMGNMSDARGWPTAERYRSGEEQVTIPGNYFTVFLDDGREGAYQPHHPFYASCTSDP